jgi:hypothetical protein
VKIGDAAFWLLMKDPVVRREWLRRAGVEIEKRCADPDTPAESRQRLLEALAVVRQTLRPEPYDPRPEDGSKR